MMRARLRELLLFWRLFGWRHWGRAPGSTAAFVFLLSLGVAVFFSIRLANRAAVAGFSLFTEAVSGENDLVLSSPAGEFDEGILPELRRVTGEIPVSFFPVLETTATEVTADGDGFGAEQFQVVGLDIPSLANLVYLTGGQNTGPRRQKNQFRGRFGEAPEAFITRQLSRERDWAVGEVIEVILEDRRVSLPIAGILPETEFSIRSPDNLLLLDLPAAQRLTGREGKVDRIELRLPAGTLSTTWKRELVPRLEAAAAGRYQLATPAGSRETGATMTQAFRLNLTILSGLALLVGVYLIFQGLEAAVVKRRPELAVLKSLGATSATLRWSWQLESLALGLIGSGLGLALGWFGAQLAVQPVARTVNALYFSNTTAAAAWHWGEAGLAFGLGLGASWLAGWLPARDAASTPPAQVLQRGIRAGGIHLLARPRWGILMFALGWVLTWAPPVELAGRMRFPVAGYLTALLWTFGGSILAGTLFPVLGVLGRNSRSAGWLFAASQLARPTGRHRLAVAGLTVAIGMAAGMSVLIFSFENTMISWINQVLKADLYVACQGAGNASSQNRLPVQTWRAIAQDPALARADVGQMHEIEFEGGRTYLVGGPIENPVEWDFAVWLERPGDTGVVEDGLPPALINESFQNRFDRGVGDVLNLPTPRGQKAARVVGVFADYGNERGSIIVNRPVVAEWFDDERAFNVAAYLREGEDPDAVRRRWLAKYPDIMVRTNSLLRAEVMRIFHQTFAVTHALIWIGIVVAVAGQALALVSILIERNRELRTLKELGMSRNGVATTVALEGAGMGLIGMTGGLTLSVALGWLLIYVINKQSFGWTLSFSIPGGDFALLGLELLATSAVVGWLMGRWAARLPGEQEE